MGTLAARLAEAEDAFHALMSGNAVVRFQDSDGTSVTYTHASIGRLSAYIERLKQQIAGKQPVRTIKIRTAKGV